MPARNTVKIYVKDSLYHLYNRGVEKRNIFQDTQDQSIFLSYLKTYLTPKDTKLLYLIITSKESSEKEKDKARKLLKLRNFSGEIELICYALMPNHFHLLVKQKSADAIDKFMNCLATRYVMYFNRKYRRTGVLFQDVYKATLVVSDEQLLHLSRYIHSNPLRLLNLSPQRWQEITFPSSLPEYFGKRQTPWIKKEHVLDYFSKTNPHNSYEDFMGMEVDSGFIAEVTIDLDISPFARGPLEIP